MKNLFFSNKYIFVILPLFLSLSIPLFSQYKFDLATKADIPELDAMYDWIIENDPDGASKIVINAKEIRGKKLYEAITETPEDTGRIFVTRDTTNNNQIVSIAKIYLIDNLKELRDILTHEIRALTGNLKESFTYPMTQAILHDFALRLERVKKASRSLSAAAETPQPAFGTPPNFSFDHVTELQRNAAYLYYGAGYTHPDHRKKRLNTLLQRYALNFIQPRVMKYIETRECNELIEIFGQVISNAERTNSIRMFALYASEIYEAMHEEPIQDFEIVYCGYSASKPDDNQPGIGKILSFSLENR